EQLVLFEVESTHRLGLASAEEDGRHFARATRALAFFNGLLDADLGHFYLARSRHYYLALTLLLRIMYIMLN
ncbi:hypothetical protein KGZ04_30225, partial [Pseudomonas aeruginosa]|uniref:hypothetical protein n=1 Tax=Pseudomonas aeruginosa TaxID=287 RepID=UPI0023417435